MNIYENLSLVNMDGEVWVNVKGWENLYQVSNLGRAKVLSRYHNNAHKNGLTLKRSKILKQNKSRGYLHILLYRNEDEQTRFDILKIRELYKTGNYTQKEIAAMFGLSEAWVQKTVTNQTWKHLEYN